MVSICLTEREIQGSGKLFSFFFWRLCMKSASYEKKQAVWRGSHMNNYSLVKYEFKDTKGVMRIRKSKKNRQHNGQKKKYKRTNNDQQNIHIKLTIE
jgi:hypothetical protein